MVWTATDTNSVVYAGQVYVEKGFLTTATGQSGYPTSGGVGGASGSGTLTWNPGTTGLIVATSGGTGVGGTGSFILYFYK